MQIIFGPSINIMYLRIYFKGKVKGKYIPVTGCGGL
jgi:hypothetical protein